MGEGDEAVGEEGEGGGAGRSWATNRGPRKAGCRRRGVGGEGRGEEEEEEEGSRRGPGCEDGEGGEEGGGERRGAEGVCSS